VTWCYKPVTRGTVDAPGLVRWDESWVDTRRGAAVGISCVIVIEPPHGIGVTTRAFDYVH